MSKRYFPAHYGERKKAKLDVTVSDHNFPLSQNSSSNKAKHQTDTWGDDNDDEILLLASQAYEDVYNEQNISTLPNYSLCMQPGSTSTQLDPIPSTSKTPFPFKKPTSSPYSSISTNLRDKCERISSPLPGLTSKVNKENMNMCDDLIINDKIFKSQDSDQLYRQLLQLQEENTKLKTENGKLLEKCVTKEGEASILRTQLKACQVSVDNARLEKIKAQEKTQVEWMEKMDSVNKQIHDLRTQLDFKNLEIISIKEKCKMLESSKIKLTQVTLGANDTSFSHKHSSQYHDRDNGVSQMKKLKVCNSSVQTESRAHYIKLNKTFRKGKSNLKQFLPLIIEANVDELSILEYNEKLKKQDGYVSKCRVFSTFHRLPSTPSVSRKKDRVSIANVYEDLTCLAAGDCGTDRCLKFINVLTNVLNEVYNDVRSLEQRMTTAFQREVDEKYIESTTTLIIFKTEDLVSCRVLFKEEQAVLARRLTAILNILLLDSKNIDFLQASKGSQLNEIVNIYCKICATLDSTSSGVLYSGLLNSITIFLHTLITNSYISQISDILRHIILSRPAPMVSCAVLPTVIELSKGKNSLKLCAGGTVGNLRLDYDQGVVLYRKDSCLLQVLLKQIETALKCIETGRLESVVVDITRNLLQFYTVCCVSSDEKTRCDCQLLLIQVIVYALRICSNILKQGCIDNKTDLLSVCRSGVQVMYQNTIKDVEFISQLGHHEGYLIELCETMKSLDHSEIYSMMLSEVSSTFQSSPEDVSPSFTKQPWLSSFETFSITD